MLQLKEIVRGLLGCPVLRLHLPLQRVWVQSLAGSKDPRRLSAKKAKLKTEVILLKIISIKTLKNGPH